MPKFWVTYKIDARYVAEVEVEDANDLTAIRRKGIDAFMDADFGEASDIDAVAVVIEDENDNYVWEKE